MNKLLLVASALINYGMQIILSVHFPANLQVHIVGVFDFNYDEMSNAEQVWMEKNDIWLYKVHFIDWQAGVFIIMNKTDSCQTLNFRTIYLRC